MPVYSAYFHKEQSLDGNGLVLVEDQFSWFAFLLPAVWAIRHQLWVALGIYAAGSVIIQSGLEFVGSSSNLQFISGVAFTFLYASFADEFRHMKLISQGYTEIGPTTGEGLEDGEKMALLILENQQADEMNKNMPETVQANGSEK